MTLIPVRAWQNAITACKAPRFTPSRPVPAVFTLNWLSASGPSCLSPSLAACPPFLLRVRPRTRESLRGKHVSPTVLDSGDHRVLLGLAGDVMTTQE